jgi:hypothetical protein
MQLLGPQSQKMSFSLSTVPIIMDDVQDLQTGHADLDMRAVIPASAMTRAESHLDHEQRRLWPA